MDAAPRVARAEPPALDAAIGRRALNALGPDVALRSNAPAAALHATCDRIRRDYRPLHLLCRFLLENTGPTTRSGDRAPFVVHMPTLFERLVAKVLPPKLPADLTGKAHEHAQSTGTPGVRLDVDLVVRDRTTGTVRLVLDTKQ